MYPITPQSPSIVVAQKLFIPLKGKRKKIMSGIHASSVKKSEKGENERCLTQNHQGHVSPFTFALDLSDEHLNYQETLGLNLQYKC